MFRNTLVKSLLGILAVSALTFNTGCFTSLAGPAQSGSEFEPVASKVVLGDLNLDGAIDAQDIQLFDWVVACDVVSDSQLTQADADAITAAYGQTGTGLREDTNRDGAVTISDLVLWAAVLEISERADVDGNGTWNRADRNKIMHNISES